MLPIINRTSFNAHSIKPSSASQGNYGAEFYNDIAAKIRAKKTECLMKNPNAPLPIEKGLPKLKYLDKRGMNALHLPQITLY